MLRHARERHISGCAYKAIDQHQVGHVIRPRDRRVVHDEHELGHAEQPLERLGGAIERRVPCEYLPWFEDLMLRVQIVQCLLYVPVQGVARRHGEHYAGRMWRRGEHWHASGAERAV